MHRVVLASAVVLAAATAACSNVQGASASNQMLPSTNILGPSNLDRPTSATLAKGGNGGGHGNGNGTDAETDSSPSLTLAMVTDINSDGVPNYGDAVTFDFSTTATAYPWVTLNCYQDGGQVYHLSLAMFLSPNGGTFPLGPTPNWQSGGADCTATLENWDEYSNRGKITALGSLSFTVVP